MAERKFECVGWPYTADTFGNPSLMAIRLGFSFAGAGFGCFISFCEQASFLIGRDGSSRLILKRRRVLRRGQAASKLVLRRTVAGPKLGPRPRPATGPCNPQRWQSSGHHAEQI
jgi:hypothetical protein